MRISEIQNYRASDPAYTDLVVYIGRDGEQTEYMFTVTLDSGDGSISDGPVGMATSPDSDYREVKHVPTDIAAAFASVRPEMVARLTISTN